MANAPNYNPTTSFATDEANNVSGRSLVRTVNLDTELANISSSVVGINNNLKLLQRDDGKLKDGGVEPYALSVQTRALLAGKGTARGNWVQNTNYLISESVQYSSTAYICLQDHNSGSVFVPALWMSISDDGSATAAAAASAASAAAALISQNSAASSAVTATTQAVTATTQAGIATTQATDSANSAAAAAALIAGSISGASQAEAEAGTNNTKFMSSLRVKQSIIALFPSLFPLLFRTTVTMRQCIQYGVSTAAGQPDLITQAQVGATLATGAVTNGTFFASVGNGYNTDGSQRNVNLVVTATKSTGTLTASVTNYMVLDTVTGVISLVSVADIWQAGGIISVTNNQYTYDYVNHIMYLGNGTTAAQVNRLVIAEIDTNATVITAIRVRAYQRKYDSGYTATLPNASGVQTRSHNIGHVPDNHKITIICTTIDATFAVGDTISWIFGGNFSGGAISPGVGSNKNTVWLSTAAAGNFLAIPKTGGAQVALTVGSWSYKLTSWDNA